MTAIKNVASITWVAALALIAVACGGSSTPSARSTPTPAQPSTSTTSTSTQGSTTATPAAAAVPPPFSSLSVADLCKVALNQDTAVYKSLGSNPAATAASSALDVLGSDFIQDAVANSYGDVSLNTDLTTLGGDAQVLSTAISSGLPTSGAYTTLTDDANVLDQECGYPTGTF